MHIEKDILFIQPPFTQLNTPYPATAFLKGFVEQHHFRAAQIDLGIETILDIFTKEGMEKLFAIPKKQNCSVNAKRIQLLQKEYIANIDAIIRFLQGKDNTPAYAIAKFSLPQASRFEQLPDMEWLFGTVSITDKAKYIATLFLEDLADWITECVDSNFGFSRYAEQIGINGSNFDELWKMLDEQNPITDSMLRLTEKSIQLHHPKVVALSVAFPGNLFAALKIARYIKRNHPNTPIILGGGFVNTELRQIEEKRLFQLVDFVCLDDGERPILQLLNHLIHQQDPQLVRTYTLVNQQISYLHTDTLPDFKHEQMPSPSYEGLPLDRYISVLEVANPMHRLWSDGRWNKLAIAHGCYWHQCSFCDVSLDYIKRYQAASAQTICNRIEDSIRQTKQTGFHFVDEAAPPNVLREMAIELIRRNIKITWWTNVRFEETFSPDLCLLLAQSGCIAVSGGLEVASDRLLLKMKKGVSIQQVARVTHNLAQAGIMVHAYLMYGFPTQTAQETIDALEVVRQLFENKLIQSAFWHRFVMTVHSPIGIQPEAFGVQRIDRPNSFALNDVEHSDPDGTEHEMFSFGLKKSLFNYMHDYGFDMHLSEWFDFEIPQTKLPPTLIANYIRPKNKIKLLSKRILWMHALPEIVPQKKNKTMLVFHLSEHSFRLKLTNNKASFIFRMLQRASVMADERIIFSQLEELDLIKSYASLQSLNRSNEWQTLRKNGLLLI